MTTAITYCVTGCRRNGHPTQTTAPDKLCRHCENTLRDWIRTIPDIYSLLPSFIEHGSTEKNPDSQATKRTEAPAPMRLDIIDLLDTRLGRRWQGLDTTDDRRGALGTLLAIAEEIHDNRNLANPPPAHVAGACDYISRHMLWLVQQDWVAEAFTEIKRLHRLLSDAIGDYRPKPVGVCNVTLEDDTECGGPLLANKYGGVRCGRCHNTWDAKQLRHLGLTLAQEAG